MAYEGRVGFSCGTGRCGTRFLVELLALEPDVAAIHERNPLNETFHRYCQWHRLPVDHEGFLLAKQREIESDLSHSRFSFEASAHLSLSILELFERFGARFILQVRRPDLVVNSYLRKGWYEQPIVRGNPELALGYQAGRDFHHFLGRVVPSGEEFLRWCELSRIGKLAWYWNALNERVLEQFSEIPDSHKLIVRLEELDFTTYGRIASFLGFDPALAREHFDRIAGRRPNALDNVPRWSHWNDAEAAEFEREVAPMAERFGYPASVSELPADDRPAPAAIPSTAAPPQPLNARMRHTGFNLVWTSARAVGAVPRGGIDLLYISHGNIPSLWANSIQTMKMSEAFGAQIPGFALLISSGLADVTLRREQLWRWYGVRRRFRILRLPTSLARRPDRARGSDPRFARMAPHYALRLEPRLVITRSRVIAVGCLRTGVPVVFEVHDRPKNRADRRRLEAIVQHPRLAGVVALNETVRGMLHSAGGRDELVAVLPDAVDPEPFEQAPDRSSARRRLGLPDDGPIAVYTGHLYDYKGIAPMLDAARLLPEVLFVLVGGWPDDVDRWRRASAEVDNVRFEGFVPNRDIPVWLAAADVCVHPHSASNEYASWTSPLKLFEYMASGRPIVATDIPALRNVLAADGNAVVVPADNAERLADGLQRILSDPSFGQRLARQARSDIERNTWTRRARTILERFAPELLSPDAG
jgi:glycosyltransferase involved in cell wall biosynthesis